MRTIDVADATATLCHYARKGGLKEALVVTRQGKPVALLRSLTADEWEDFVVSSDPRFIAMIERSRARHKPGTGIPLADVMRKYGVRPKAARRLRNAR